MSAAPTQMTLVTTISMPGKKTHYVYVFEGDANVVAEYSPAR